MGPFPFRLPSRVQAGLIPAPEGMPDIGAWPRTAEGERIAPGYVLGRAPTEQEMEYFQQVPERVLPAKAAPKGAKPKAVERYEESPEAREETRRKLRGTRAADVHRTKRLRGLVEQLGPPPAPGETLERPVPRRPETSMAQRFALGTAAAADLAAAAGGRGGDYMGRVGSIVERERGGRFEDLLRQASEAARRAQSSRDFERQEHLFSLQNIMGAISEEQEREKMHTMLRERRAERQEEFERAAPERELQGEYIRAQIARMDREPTAEDMHRMRLEAAAFERETQQIVMDKKLDADEKQAAIAAKAQKYGIDLQAAIRLAEIGAEREEREAQRKAAAPGEARKARLEEGALEEMEQRRRTAGMNLTEAGRQRLNEILYDPLVRDDPEVMAAIQGAYINALDQARKGLLPQEQVDAYVLGAIMPIAKEAGVGEKPWWKSVLEWKAGLERRWPQALVSPIGTAIQAAVED